MLILTEEDKKLIYKDIAMTLDKLHIQYTFCYNYKKELIMIIFAEDGKKYQQINIDLPHWQGDLIYLDCHGNGEDYTCTADQEYLLNCILRLLYDDTIEVINKELIKE